MKEALYITLAYNYLQLAKEAINEMEKQGNQTLIISGKRDDDDDGWNDYERNTRWNDSNIGVPVLFNFYHGLELFMKGLQFRVSSASKSNDHNLQDLYRDLVNPEYHIPKKLILLFKKYIYSENPFQRFFEDNKGTANDFYTFLKYPESKTNKSFIFRSIRGNEEPGLSRYIEVRDDIIRIRQEMRAWLKSYD
jgi:hypothetical protein